MNIRETAPLHRIILERNRTAGEAAAAELSALGLDARWLALDTSNPGPVVPAAVQNALREGFYSSLCPFTGETVISRNTFLVMSGNRGYLLIRFEQEQRVFYRLCDPLASAMLALYVPDLNLLVSHANYTSVIARFEILLGRHHDAVCNYIAMDSRERAVVVDSLSHLGHWAFNELPALQWLFASGEARYVSSWLSAGVSFVELAALFPEIPADQIIHAPDPDQAFLAPLEKPKILVMPRVNSYAANADVAVRLRRAVVAAPAPRIEASGPIIWFEIRTNDRCWIDQAEGIASVAKRLHRNHPGLAIVLGGWSRMLPPMAADEKAIKADRKVMDEIAALIPDIPCFPVVGETVAAKAQWALRCDVQCSIFGTGAFFSSMIAGLPGVVLAGERWRRHGFTTTPIFHNVEVLSEGCVIEDDVAGRHGFRVDLDVLAAKLTALLEDDAARRQRVDRDVRCAG